MTDISTPEHHYCANCATPLEGEFCHHCGQSVHSVLRPLHHMAEDTLDMVLHVDHRVLHTLPPLFARPGYVTMEYFAGRRVRYVAPFRLMFVLCLLAFFVSRVAIDEATNIRGFHGAPAVALVHDAPGSGPFDTLDSAAQVRQALDQQLDDLESVRRTVANGSVTAQVDVAEKALIAAADKRLAALGAAPASTASLPAAAASASVAARDARELAANQQARQAFIDTFAGTTSDKKMPETRARWLAGSITGKEQPEARIAWLPAFMNARLAHASHQMRQNVHDLSAGGEVAQAAFERIVAGVFGVLPPVLFVMLPLFALLLKLFYVFQRRLYMEHLIVALHSHAFLFLELMLLVLLSWLTDAVVPHAHWLGPPLNLLNALLWLWAPLYLLLMQKRIYGQGWGMTLLKYWCLGWLYFWMLLAALMVAAVLGLTH